MLDIVDMGLEQSWIDFAAYWHYRYFVVVDNTTKKNLNRMGFVDENCIDFVYEDCMDFFGTTNIYFFVLADSVGNQYDIVCYSMMVILALIVGNHNL